MISIILSILKIIGIVLLCILGILIGLVLLFLFVPIRYRFGGSYHEKPILRVRVSWLLRILTCSIMYEDEFLWKIKVLGIPVFPMSKKTARKEQEKPPVSSLDMTSKIKKEEPEKSEIKKEEPKEPENPENPEKHIEEGIKEKKQPVASLLKKIKDNFKDFERYYKFFTSDSTKEAFRVCKRRVFSLLKSIFPKKCKAIVHFGMEDPAMTGQILAFHGMLYPVIGNTVSIYPEFEKKVFEADFSGKGRIYLFIVLYQVIRVITDRNCQKFINQMKKEIADE
ncbi:MAG: DUF2953 domain-containing protein [Lachnospiraceae bacterium]|nr:DUF2953 domain-containing protein [Lachnospiraceae bacterium]